MRIPPAARLAAAAAVASILAACATAVPGAPIDAEAVYRARCSLCHPAWTPTDFAPEEWPKFVKKYGPRSGLTRDEHVAVLAYLVREAGRR